MEKNLINYRYSHRRIALEHRKAMKISYKIWLDHHGKAFGDGPYELLRRVEKTKSLHQGANQMGMAYSKAWRMIRTLEQRLGFRLLERKAGGASGGGSRITPKAKELMKHYGQFQKDVKDCMERIYRRHFSSMAKKAQK
jgi:molybdate transport system regulatory protein